MKDLYADSAPAEKINKAKVVYDAYWHLRYMSRSRMVLDVMVIITLLATWLNKWRADMYLIALPVSYITFAVISIYLVYHDAFDVEISLKVESIEDHGKGAKFYGQLHTQPRISACCVLMLCIFS